MYAFRWLYVKKWDHQSPDERYEVRVTFGGKPVKDIKTDRISSVEEGTMHWHEANHIHGWFVDNVQAGEDDCDEYEVSQEKLLELHDVCGQVLAASKLVDGTFYGGTVDDKDHQRGLIKLIPGKVIEDPTVAKKLLPTRSGVGFGRGDYDKLYLINVKDTRDWAARMIADRKDGVSGAIYYTSSWGEVASPLNTRLLVGK